MNKKIIIAIVLIAIGLAGLIFMGWGPEIEEGITDIESNTSGGDIKASLAGSGEYTVDGDKVYKEDSNAYISATPHTLDKSGNVIFTIKSKTYTGDMNVIWGFNTTRTKPRNAELYNPTTNTWNETNSMMIYNVTSNAPVENTTCDYGNQYNSIHQNVTYLGYNNTNETTEVFCFDSYTQSGDDYNITWDTIESETTYWQDVSSSLNSIDKNLDGKNKWYYAQNVPINAGQEYKIRSYVEVKPNSEGKYDFAVYPSSYGTDIQQAYSDGNLYLLDPWWDSSYEERYKHNDNGSSYTGIGYFGANVTGWYGTIGNDAYTYNDTDTGDLIVANETDELCWFDTQNNESGCPNKPDGLVSYYALDRDSGNVEDYIGGNDGTNNGATRGVTGQVGDAFDFDGSDDWIEPYDFLSSDDESFSWNLWFNLDDVSTRQILISSTNPSIEIEVNNGDLYLYTSEGTGDRRISAGSLETGKWYRTTLTYNHTSDEFNLYLNATGSSYSAGTINNQGGYSDAIGGAQRHAPEGIDLPTSGKIDDVRIYDRALTSAEVSNLYSSTSTNTPYLESAETDNTAPNSPTLNNPADGETGVSTSPTLNLTVTDPDGDDMNVSFYDNSDNSLIGTAEGVANGSYATTTWSGLSELTNYKWYANVSDGSLTTQSSTYNFTTEARPNITLNAPADNYQTDVDNNEITFNCTATDDVSVVNVSLYIDGSINETNSSGIDGDYIFTKSLSRGNHTWTCEGTDSESQTSKPGARDINVYDIELNAPANNAVINDSSVLLNASVWGSDSMNVSFYGEENYLNRYNNDLCYQESANVSNQTGIDGNCNLSYDGNYRFEGNYWQDKGNIIDGDWDTYGLWSLAGHLEYIYINYSKPERKVYRANWSVKYRERINKSNITIPNSCFNYYNDKLRLRIEHNAYPFSVNYYCYNGSWNHIFSPESSKYVYEEAIIWKVRESINTTEISSGNSATYNWTGLKGNRTYEWYSGLEDGSHNLNSELRVFTTDSDAPEINVTAPTDVTPLGYVGKNQSINLTVSDNNDNLDTCWYNYNGTNTTFDCSNNITLSLESYGFDHSIQVWANDTLGNTGTDIHSWDYLIFENSQSYESSVSEGQRASFSINISYDGEEYVPSGYLVYNGTEYPAETGDGGNITILSRNITVPEVGSNTDFDFHWYIGMTNSSGTTYINSSSNSQTLTTINMSETGSPYTPAFIDFTAYDEQTDEEINATFSATFTYMPEGGEASNTYSYTDMTENNSQWSFSFDPSNQNYSIDASLELDADGYVHKFYNFKDLTVYNTTREMGLYLLPEASSTSFIVSVRDSSYTPLTGVEVHVQRYYPSSNEWKTVEVTETDENGKTVQHFYTEDVEYRFKVYDEGLLLYTTEKTQIYCESSPCTVEIIIPEEFDYILDDYVPLDNLDSTLEYDEDSEEVTFTYSDTSGNFTSGRLYVVRTHFGNATEIEVCNKTSGNPTAVMDCDMSSAPNATYIAIGYVTRNKENMVKRISFKKIEEIVDKVGEDGVLWAIFLMIGIMMLGVYRPSLGIIFGSTGLIMLSLLNIISIPITALVAAVGIAVILLIGVNKQ